MPGSSCSVVDEANDLKPRSVRLFRNNEYSSRAATWAGIPVSVTAAEPHSV
jgi:hypothetical protein